MKAKPAERRLSAILAADVVGYSRLMGVDEEGTLAALTAHTSEHIEPCVAYHRGRVVKTTGDGLLAEFSSVVDAVNCAIAFQQGMTERQQTEVGVPKIEFRIGVNLGDIIVQNDDVFGDGVNIAARLEGLCAPGEVYVSGTVHDHAEGKLPVAFEDLGAKAVKNIAKPVRVYRAFSSENADGTPTLTSKTVQVHVSERPAIAVLPFENRSGDPEQEYFSDGVSEDILTALSHIRWLLVVSRNSSFVYKGRMIDGREVARDLGVRYLVNGSVRKAGNRIRISAQLIDGATGSQLWAEKYDRELEDVFAIQDEITQTIVGAIQPEMERAETVRAMQKQPEELGAWELNQRGVWNMWKRLEEPVQLAVDLLKQAIALEPGLARAHGNLSNCYRTQYVYGWTANSSALGDAAIAAAKRAIELDDQDSWGHAQLGAITSVTGDFGLSRSESEIAVRQNPSSTMAYFALGSAFVFSGEAERAIEPLKTALLLSPNDPWQGSISCRLAEAYLCMRNPEESVMWAERASLIPPVSVWVYAAQAAALGHLGRIVAAETASRNLMNVKSDFTSEFIKIARTGIDEKFYDYFADGLEKAGIR